MISRIGLLGLLCWQIVAAADVASTPEKVTFHRDVLPILQRNCQSCHRPGQVAPMAFLDYAGVRPWAKAIKQAVVSKKMPPWFANPQYGHFLNDRSLKQQDIDILAKWADTNAEEGNAEDAPAPVQWPSGGWDIQPDFVVEGPATLVPAHPAKNVIEWNFITVPSGLTEDKWITSLQILPSEPSVTHHICVFFKPHTADVKYNQPVWADRQRDEDGAAVASAAGINGRGIPESITAGTNGVEGCYVPGQISQDYRTHNAAKLVKAGTDIVFQLHYTPVGKDITDQPKIGFTFAKEQPQNQFVSFGISSPSDAKSFAIPPQEANWASPPAEAEFTADTDLVWMFPHMHVRGKDMTYKLVYPDGKTETVLDVPRYDFNWQLGYDLAQPIHVPKGTHILVTAHYDNSVNNKFNPDPNKTVYYGDMTWEEMMFPFFSVIVDRDVDSKHLIKVIRGKKADGA